MRACTLRTSEGRLRTPWRLLVAAAFFMFVSLGVSAAAVAVGLAPAPGSPGVDPFAVVGPHILNGTALALAVVVAARFLDRRRYAEFGLSVDRRWWRDLLVGLGLGFGLIAAAYLVGVAVGVYEPTLSPAAPDGYTVLRAFALVSVFTCVVGLYEELLFRGYLLPNVADGLTALLDDRHAILGAVGLSGIGFGAVHGLNPGMTLLGVGTIAVAGFLLGLGYVLTGRLALPIGVHVTWNFAQFVFGLPVSGIDLGIRFLRTERVGSPLLHGGLVGPEGGVLGLAAALVGCVLVAVYAAWIGDGAKLAAVGRTRPGGGTDQPPR